MQLATSKPAERATRTKPHRAFGQCVHAASQRGAQRPSGKKQTAPEKQMAFLLQRKFQTQQQKHDLNLHRPTQGRDSHQRGEIKRRGKEWPVKRESTTSCCTSAEQDGKKRASLVSFASFRFERTYFWFRFQEQQRSPTQKNFGRSTDPDADRRKNHRAWP